MKSDSLSDLHPRAERAGPIASDSLAAESTRQGGGFSENRGAEPLGVKGSSSNFANTDTSGATTLAPARDAAERDANATENDIPDDLKGPGGRKYPEALGGQKDIPRVHGSENYSGESTEAKQELRSDEPVYQSKDVGSKTSGTKAPEETEKASTSDEPIYQSKDVGSKPSETQAPKETEQASTTDDPVYQSKEAGSKPSEKQAPEESEKASNPDNPANETRETETPSSRGPAPSYVASSTLGGKPKGNNLTEGGFDDDPANNASFNPDINSEDDPAREAIKHLQGVTQSGSGDGGAVQNKLSGEGQFDVLDTEERL